MVASKHRLVLGMCSDIPPRYGGENELTLAVIVHMPLWKNLFFFSHVACHCDLTLYSYDSSSTSMYKFPDSLNKGDYGMRL